MLRLLAQREQGYGDIAALTGQSVDEVRAKVRDAVAALDGDAVPAGDQKAILRLLAQREEGYGDIAALTGQSVEEVRAKVGAALVELDGDAGPSPPAPADPKPRVEEKPAVPTKPPAVPPPKPAAEKKSPPKPASPGKARLKLPDDKGAVYGLGAGLAVVLILVILLATGALGGGDSESGGGEVESSVETGGEGTSSNASPKPTEAVLRSVDGSEASGRALFGKAKKQVVLLVRAKGLQPAPKGKSYTLSLSKSPTERLPLVATQVNKKGEVLGSFPVAAQVLGLLASGYDEMELSIVADTELTAALKAAKNAKAPPNYTGSDILRGQVTGAIVEAGEHGKVKP
jgi:hypothetical protein